MNGVRTAQLFRRVDAFEHAWCLRLNRGCSQPAVRDIFAAISKLGDGVFWYVLIVLLPVVYGETALYPALRMAAVGFIGVGLYKYLKSRLVRERPYISLAGIVPGTRALDRYSFPSGHTLHAVSFTTLAVNSFPELAWLLVPFADAHRGLARRAWVALPERRRRGRAHRRGPRSAQHGAGPARGLNSAAWPIASQSKSIMSS